MPRALEPIDPACHPDLSGVLAPVDDEIEVADLPVIGKIPEDLHGVYLRNGPNPKFPPLGSYTYPLDGDGMIHGVWLAQGKARYRNRYVVTKGLQAEIRAGRALWGGILTPTMPPAALVGPDQDPEGDKLLPGINIVRHAHRLLALGEGTAPYEMTGELATIGRYDFAGGLPLGMCAHPKIDPASGEMIVFRYGLEEPYLYWAAIGPDGTVTRPPEVVAEIDRGYMIHDFMITEDFLVLVINPATFDLARAARGAGPLAWEPDRGTRIAVIPRHEKGGKIRWAETDAFWCWHYANGWQEGREIVTVFPWWSHLGFGIQGAPPVKGHLARARIDPGSGSVRLDMLDERPTEFPRIDDRRQGRPTRYAMASHRASPALRLGAYDELLRLDLARGTIAVHRFPGQAIGEAAFAPKPGRSEEEAGYILTFTTDLGTMQSRFVILDAEDFSAAPVAVVTLPRRVPLGLHGNWCPMEA
ncbi:MAG TPA: carotenoid oxygenase family protein [Acetobacteraceae bacterium]|nr:carotenoid oxygenase family protein [Acetobacteraceae bacterium]